MKYTLIIATKLGAKGNFYCKAENQDAIFNSLKGDGWHVEHVLVDREPSQRGKDELEKSDRYPAHEREYTKMVCKTKGAKAVPGDFICKTQDKDFVFNMLTTIQGWNVEHVLDNTEPTEQAKAWLVRSINYPCVFDKIKMNRKSW